MLKSWPFLAVIVINKRATVENPHKPERAGLICLSFRGGPSIIRQSARRQRGTAMNRGTYLSCAVLAQRGRRLAGYVGLIKLSLSLSLSVCLSSPVFLLLRQFLVEVRGLTDPPSFDSWPLNPLPAAARRPPSSEVVCVCHRQKKNWLCKNQTTSTVCTCIVCCNQWCPAVCRWLTSGWWFSQQQCGWKTVRRSIAATVGNNSCCTNTSGCYLSTQPVTVICNLCTRRLTVVPRTDQSDNTFVEEQVWSYTCSRGCDSSEVCWWAVAQPLSGHGASSQFSSR